MIVMGYAHLHFFIKLVKIRQSGLLFRTNFQGRTRLLGDIGRVIYDKTTSCLEYLGRQVSAYRTILNSIVRT